MSSSEVQTILQHLAPLQEQVAAILREHQSTRNELADVRRELVMARRQDAKPYYTTDELCHLLGKPATEKGRKAARQWAARRGVTSHGHNQWDRATIDTILGLD